MPINNYFQDTGIWISNHKATLCVIGAGVAAVILLTFGISNCSGKKKAVTERDGAYKKVERCDSINKVMYQRLQNCGNKSDSLGQEITKRDFVIQDLKQVNDSLVIANDSLQAGWDNCRTGKKTVAPSRPVSPKPVKPVQTKPVKPVQSKPAQPVQTKPVAPSNVPSGVTVNINSGANVQTVFGNVTNNYGCTDSTRVVKQNPADMPEPVARRVNFRREIDVKFKQDTNRQR